MIPVEYSHRTVAPQASQKESDFHETLISLHIHIRTLGTSVKGSQLIRLHRKALLAASLPWGNIWRGHVDIKGGGEYIYYTDGKFRNGLCVYLRV